MGAAGYVTVYDLATVEAAYERLFPGHDVRADLQYANDPTTHEHGRDRCWPEGKECRKTEEHRRSLVLHLPTGQRLLLDYADDQGNNEGLTNDFWFNTDWDDLVDRPDWMSRQDAVPERWKQSDKSYERFPDKTWASYARFHTAIREPDVWKQEVEVWT